MGFWKKIYENAKKKEKKRKKKLDFTTKIALYMGHKHFEVSWTFILHILSRLVLLLKKPLCFYSSVYV